MIIPKNTEYCSLKFSTEERWGCFFSFVDEQAFVQNWQLIFYRLFLHPVIFRKGVLRDWQVDVIHVPIFLGQFLFLLTLIIILLHVYFHVLWTKLLFYLLCNQRTHTDRYLNVVHPPLKTENKTEIIMYCWIHII